MRFLARTTCKLKGHIWAISPGPTPSPDATGSYIVHNHCFRCGVTRKERREAVPFVPRSA